MQAYLNCMLSKQMFNPKKLHSTTAILTQTTTLICFTIFFFQIGPKQANPLTIGRISAIGKLRASSSSVQAKGLERIDACPLQRGNKVDLFGRQIVWLWFP